MEREIIDKITFIGSKHLGLQVLKNIFKQYSNINVITLDDTDDTRTEFHKFLKFTNQNNIPCYISKDRKDFEVIIQQIKPDICIVVGWYWIIRPEILNQVPYGFIGVHNSLLPEYRGFAPLVWSIINGKSKVSFSLFSFSEGMDEGDIWIQKSIDIRLDEYVDEILDSLENLTVDTINEI